MDPLTVAALERLRAAVADKPVGVRSYTGVDPADVLLVAAEVPAPTPTVMALVKGARGAVGQNTGGEPVYQDTDHLRHMLELVK